MNTLSRFFTSNDTPEKSVFCPKPIESSFTERTSFPLSIPARNENPIPFGASSGRSTFSMRSSAFMRLSALMKFFSRLKRRCCSMIASCRAISFCWSSYFFIFAR